jgi:hypothetical protein
MSAVKGRLSPVIDSELEETDETAADHASRAMGESASVEVLSAKVCVLQVGNGQITRSMYRQLDEATPEQFQPLGRVKDNKRIAKEWGRPKEGMLQLVGRDTKTGALVRYEASPPDWSASNGPEEFTHWLMHQPEIRRSFGQEYPVAVSDEFDILWKEGFSYRICDAPRSWHVSEKTPKWVRQLDRLSQLEMRQQRCQVDLDELKRQWQEKANSELAEMLKAQARYDELKALPLIVFA